MLGPGVSLSTRSGVAGHKHRFKDKKFKNDTTKYSFVNRTVSDWNRLPAPVVEAASLDSFKAQLAEARRP